MAKHFDGPSEIQQNLFNLISGLFTVNILFLLFAYDLIQCAVLYFITFFHNEIIYIIHLLTGLEGNNKFITPRYLLLLKATPRAIVGTKG